MHDRPTLIIVRTHIGYGSPHKQDTSAAHGEPLGVDEVKLTKQSLGLGVDGSFHVPPEALAAWREARERGAPLRSRLGETPRCLCAGAPDSARELDRRLAGTLPEGWDARHAGVPAYEKGMATRAASNVINALAPKIPELVGGAADLSTSTKTIINAERPSRARRRPRRAATCSTASASTRMGAIMNGMCVHGGIIPFGGTFLIFSTTCGPRHASRRS